MAKPKTVGNSWTENVLRGTGVAVRRESIRLLKELSLEKRKMNQTRRLLDKQQRSVRVLIGRDAYPGGSSSGDRDEALNEFHPPGFCFKKNGEPRTPKSIHEAGTRKILPMDVTPGGIKVQGTPAINVICSDSTSLGEALSKRGETLALLSEIRNTSALLQNPKILEEAWGGDEEEEDPKAFMKQYRKSLLRRLFSILEGCSEVDDILQNKNSGYRVEYDELDVIPAELSEQTFASSRRSQLSLEVARDPTQILFRHHADGESLEADQSVGGLVKSDDGIIYRNNTNNATGPSSKHVSFSKSSSKKGSMGQKTLLQVIIKKLVNKIRLMDQMGQGLLEYKRKRPYVNSDHLWGPLIKLLERQSLFSSLTDSERSKQDEEEEGSWDSPPPLQLSSGAVNHILNPSQSGAVRTRRSIRCEACRQRVLSPLKKSPSYSPPNPLNRRSTKYLYEPQEDYPDPGQSWTLSVSRMDLVRLHHELHTDMVSSRMAAIASSSFILPVESLGE